MIIPGMIHSGKQWNYVHTEKENIDKREKEKAKQVEIIQNNALSLVV